MPKPAFRFFSPILAGATLRDRLLATVGALVGIGLTAFICSFLFDGVSYLALIVAPMGASAVLLFAVPTSPLAQPWPIIGGNVLSAFVGVAVAQVIDDPAIAAGLAVSLAILLMSMARCLHPPGGAAALTAVLGGEAVMQMGFLFPLVPVGLNAVLLVATGVIFHRLARRTYPHFAPPVPANAQGTQDIPPQLRVGVQREDIDKALGKLGEGFDIDGDDLERLVREIQFQAQLRSGPELTCADIMSRDVISVQTSTPANEAHELMIRHNVRVLPVLGGDGLLAGTVGLRELVAGGDVAGSAMSKPISALPQDPALTLLPALTNGTAHGVVIVNDSGSVVGLITQTDLLAALANQVPMAQGKSKP